MRKRVFSKILLILLSVVFFAACDRGTKPPPVPTPPTPPIITNPEKKPITDYFNSIVEATYLTKNDFVTDIDGKSVAFTIALERQIELISDDILYRLFAVYGAGAGAKDDNLTGTYNLTYGNNKTFSYNGKLAQINNFNLLQEPKEIIDNYPTYLYSTGEEVKVDAVTLNNPNITELASHSFFIRNGIWEVYSIVNTTITRNFRNSHAINGGYTWSDETNRFNDLGFNKKDLSWNWDYNELNITPTTSVKTAYDGYYNVYYNQLKTNIANILATGTVGDLNYETAINKIDHLGFTENDKQNFVNYIYNNVIGTNLITQDNNLKTSIMAKIPNGILTTDSIKLLTEEEHYYKAYSLLVPAIINQAINNTFESTTKSLYLTEDLVVTNSLTAGYNTLLNKNYTSIKLSPKTSNVPLTKLLIKISNINTSNLEFSYNIFTNATTQIANNKKVSLTPNVTTSENTLDFSSYNEKLSNNGYIELMFENNQNATFNISFEGYYNKI